MGSVDLHRWVPAASSQWTCISFLLIHNFWFVCFKSTILLFVPLSWILGGWSIVNSLLVLNCFFLRFWVCLKLEVKLLQCQAFVMKRKLRVVSITFILTLNINNGAAAQQWHGPTDHCERATVLSIPRGTPRTSTEWNSTVENQAKFAL